MSREKDAEIAEKVFGWKSVKEDPVFGFAEWMDEFDEECALPPYSTTWEGMGLVIAELTKKRFRLEMIATPKGWNVGIGKIESQFVLYKTGGEYDSYSEFLPMAVADAALKAVKNDSS